MLHTYRLIAGARRALTISALIIVAGLLLLPAMPASISSMPTNHAVIKARPKPVPSSTTEESADAPIARIDAIISGGAPKIEASYSEVRVTRPNIGGDIPVQLNMGLFAGDIVETGRETQVTISFATDDPMTNDTEVILYPETKVSVGSLWTWAGRTLNRVRGYFNSGSSAGTGATGHTEFIVSVPQNNRFDLSVLDGLVNVSAFDISINQVADLKTFAFKNDYVGRLPKTHTFEFKRPDNMPWLELLPTRVRLRHDQSVTVVPTVKFKDREDAPSPNTYQGQITINCLDCESYESDLGLDPRYKDNRVPIEVAVYQSPSGKVEPVAKRNWLRRAKGDTNVQSANIPGSELTRQIEETTQLILAAAPKFPTGYAVPNFSSFLERNHAFTRARANAIFSNEKDFDDNYIDSYKTLGDVYLDWLEGARSVQAYEKVERGGRLSKDAAFHANYAEALLLTGNLEAASTRVNLAASLERSRPSARTLTAQGNLQIGLAQKAFQEKRDAKEVLEHLDKAQKFYSDASKLSEDEKSLSPPQRAAVLRNLGDSYSIKGELIYSGKISDPKCEQVSQCIIELDNSALNAYLRALSLDSNNISAMAGAGYVYLEQGDIERLKGGRATKEFYSRAEKQFDRALSLDPTYPGAYIGLAIASENLNSKSVMERQFKIAAQLNARVVGESVRVPDARGKPRMVAMKGIIYAGLIPVVSGNGEFVTDQNPDPGKPLRPGEKVYLQFGLSNTRIFQR